MARKRPYNARMPPRPVSRAKTKPNPNPSESCIARHRRAYGLTTLDSVHELERIAVQKALLAATQILNGTRGVLSLAARLLGIDRSRLRRKIVLHGLTEVDDEGDVI